MATAYVAVGSNLGNRRRYCELAVARLRAHPAVRVVGVSTWHEYPALTIDPSEAQPDYLNGVIALETTLSPEALLGLCHTIETEAGRDRTAGRWQPRTLDLDLLAYDELTMDTPDLILPHPELHQRRFVLEPWCELHPTWRHPLLHRTVPELLAELSHGR